MKSKQLLMLGVVVVCASLTAFADTVTFVNTDGMIGSNTARTTLTMTNSLLTGFSGLSSLGISDQSVIFSSCKATGCLGTVNFTTGAKMGGFLLSPSATFGTGGTITVTESNFTFSGQLTSATWTCTVNSAQACNGTGGTWFFDGTILGGTLTINGHTFAITTAATVQVTTSGAAPGNGLAKTGPVTWVDAGGTTTFPTPVPEPGSLGLVGSGLVGLGALAKRRAARHKSSA